VNTLVVFVVSVEILVFFSYVKSSFMWLLALSVGKLWHNNNKSWGRKCEFNLELSQTSTIYASRKLNAQLLFWILIMQWCFFFLPGELWSILSKHKGPIFSLKWNKKGDYLLTGSCDQSAIVWDVKAMKWKQQFEFHSGKILNTPFLTRCIFWTL